MKLFSRKIGDKGQDLIVLHGLFGMSDNWVNMGNRFSKYCKVHLLDLRNHGRSPHANEFDFDVMCEDLLEYIDDNTIIKPIILGHSLGGKVAIKFAFTYPEKMEKLIVADIAPRNYNMDFHYNLLQSLYKIPLDEMETREEIDSLLSIIVKDKDIRLFLMKNLYRNDRKKFAWRMNIGVLLEKLHHIQDAVFLQGISDIPTHFLKGEYSDYITAEDEKLISKYFSDVSFATIPKAGHWLHVENPERFYEEVMGFCLL